MIAQMKRVHSFGYSLPLSTKFQGISNPKFTNGSQFFEKKKGEEGDLEKQGMPNMICVCLLPIPFSIS
ncbi:hypothetical protein Hanom_Chr03g00191271 [Helianthus anomalus]